MTTSSNPKKESIWVRYWKAYGGCSALFNSPYFWMAAALTVLLNIYWRTCGWWETPLAVMPNLLGFSLGGLALMLGMIQPRVLKLLSEKETDDEQSLMSEFTASFTHFVIVQSLALILAFILEAAFSKAIILAEGDSFGNSLNSVLHSVQFVVSGITFFVFVYALLLTIATAIEVFRFAEMLQSIAREYKDTEN